MKHRHVVATRKPDGQLGLLQEEPRDWQLDDHTRQLGRQGVAAARAALRQASRRPAA